MALCTHILNTNFGQDHVSIFSLAIDTLEMVFELQTGKLIGIQGFLPLGILTNQISAINTHLFEISEEKFYYLMPVPVGEIPVSQLISLFAVQ